MERTRVVFLDQCFFGNYVPEGDRAMTAFAATLFSI